MLAYAKRKIGCNLFAIVEKACTAAVQVDAVMVE
jgi:hypothetical protein